MKVQFRKNTCMLYLGLNLFFLVGCQTARIQEAVSPSEFPTIDIANVLYVEIRENVYPGANDNVFSDAGKNSQLYFLFKDALLSAFDQLEYPGEIVINRWPVKVEDAVPLVYIGISDWGLDRHHSAYKCTIQPAIFYQGIKTDLGQMIGEDETYAAMTESSVKEKGYSLAAEDALKEFFRGFLPYTNARF